MQELRLVAVSEDGTYLVLATAGRGTRFTLPVDDRLRAAVRGHFSRLGQFEIEVESPLRPKEIQARIRSGETAEEIAESAGIPVERVRWFEGPVLQEREYMAQQAQRVGVRRPGESTPGPPLGETVEERLGRGGVDLDEIEWDSWKCEDSTWRVRLSFFDNGRPHAAEWVFDPRRRHVAPLDEVAARLTAVDWEDEELGDTVTPLVPRRPAMKVVSDGRDFAAPPARGIGFESEPGGERPPVRAADPPRVSRPRIAEPPAASHPPARPFRETPRRPEERSSVPEPREPRTEEAASGPAPVPGRQADAPHGKAAADAPAGGEERDEALATAPEEPAAGEAASKDSTDAETDAGTKADATAESASKPASEAAAESEAEEQASAAGPEAHTDAEAAAEPAKDEPAKDEPAPDESKAVEDDAPAEAEPDAEPAGKSAAGDAQGEDGKAPAHEPEPGPAAGQEETPHGSETEAKPEPEPERTPEPAADAGTAAEPAADPVADKPAAREPAAGKAPAAPEKPAARQKPQPAAKTPRPAHRETGRTPAKKKSAGRPAMPPAPAEKPVGPPAAAAAAAGDAPAPQRPARNRRKSKGRRASVPSWDEIMFGARRPD